MTSALVATLISNPADPQVSTRLAEAAYSAVDAHALYWLADGIACDLPLKNGANKAKTAKALAELTRGFAVDCVIQPADQRRKKLLIADMDSTMIGQECIDELAAEIGIKEKVATITAKAMNGEIEFEPALIERVALLKGLNTSVIDEVIAKRITFTQGGATLVATMKKFGGHAALVSGGFTQFTSRIAAHLGFDENHANRLIEADGKLTGEVGQPILGAQAKVDALNAIATKLNIGPDMAIAVGDGANDLPMLKLAGSGVALHAKPTVAAEADIRIDHGDLTALLYIQGYRQSDFASKT